MYDKRSVEMLSGVVLLATLCVASALFLIVQEHVSVSQANTPVSNVLPEKKTVPPPPTEVAYSTPPALVAEALAGDTMRTDDTERTETISAPPPVTHTEVIKATNPPTARTATVVSALPAPIKKESRAEGFSASIMLRMHNTVRSAHGLAPLTWSDELAQSSSRWGETLVRRGCDFYHDPDTEYGENLFWKWISDSNNSGLISSPEDAVTWWADEIEYYNYTNNSCRRGKDCGHYTQIVWAETTEVGCSVHTCFDRANDNTQTDLWVCRYNPPGNIEGERPY